MFTKLTAATLVTSLLLIGCSDPIANDVSIETAPMDDMADREVDAVLAPEPTALDLTGTYAMTGVACDFIAGTMSISETSIRLSETVCDIVQSQQRDNMTMAYTLSGCRNDAGAEPDRDVTVTQTADGNISVTKWSDQTSVYNVCE